MLSAFLDFLCIGLGDMPMLSAPHDSSSNGCFTIGYLESDPRSYGTLGELS